jgi:hypothetical protein
MKYKSYRGKMVDIDELRRKHEKTVAAGNMSVNAKGDTLGPGGEILETTQRKARKHYTTTQTTRTSVSIKGDQETAEVFAEEKKKTEPKKKTAAKKAKPIEIEDDDGNITLQEPETDDELFKGFDDED